MAAYPKGTDIPPISPTVNLPQITSTVKQMCCTGKYMFFLPTPRCTYVAVCGWFHYLLFESQLKTFKGNPRQSKFRSVSTALSFIHPQVMDYFTCPCGTNQSESCL